jgi:3-dehydrosphinganine reductase
MPSMTKLSGAHAVVTGGSSGIGLAVATRLAQKGARVSIIARDEPRLVAARDAIVREVPPAQVAVAAADVTDEDRVVAALASLTDAFGPCQVLVTAAGDAHPGYFEQLPASVFREQMELDYFGTLHAVRAVVPSMIEHHGGHIVLVASTVALVGVFGYTAYAPAKHAVRGLAETLRAELARHHVVVACAYPPDTRTPGLERENLLKPPETAAVSGTIKAVDASRVGTEIVRGIERDRVVITADVQTAALLRLGGVVRPVLDRWFDRTARRARPR